MVERSRRSSRNNAWESSENKGSIWGSTKDNWSLCQIRGWFVKSTNYCLCCPLMEIAVMISKEPHRIFFRQHRSGGGGLKSGVMKVSVKPINSALLWILNFLGSFLFHQHFATWFLDIILPPVQRLCCSPLRGCWEMKECGSWGPAGLGLWHNSEVTLAPNVHHLMSSAGLDEGWSPALGSSGNHVGESRWHMYLRKSPPQMKTIVLPRALLPKPCCPGCVPWPHTMLLLDGVLPTTACNTHWHLQV